MSDLSAIKSAQQPTSGDKQAGILFDPACFFPSDNSTTLGKLNDAMAGGKSAFNGQAFPSAKDIAPPTAALTRNDTNFNVQAAMAPIAMDNAPSSKNQEEAMKVFDNV